MQRYPHEFSGGQRQRISIARVLVVNPKLIIADEPVSALDVSIRAQILNLLVELQREFHLAYLLISHDLSVVKYMCDRVAVMYLGRMVEVAEREELYERYQHPYTEALLSAIPVPAVRERRGRIVLKGDVPSPIEPPKGCRFHPRCSYRAEPCDKVEPELKDIGHGHYVACHLR
jgi:oligopeptide/dipeptide ABC transporter ATP-binding protein